MYLEEKKRNAHSKNLKHADNAAWQATTSRKIKIGKMGYSEPCGIYYLMECWPKTVK